ncbi:MAG: hypothetical protein ACI9TH_003393 [Kiritimatiellia bacterium]|jgi:hypothetical protein
MKNPNTINIRILHHLVLVLMLLPSLPRADLVGHWSLDTDGSDQSGMGFHGQADLNGGTISFGETGARPHTGGAVRLADGGHLDIPWEPELNSSNFTVTAWVNADEAGGGVYRSPLSNRDYLSPDGSAYYGWILYNKSNGDWSAWNGGGDNSSWYPRNADPVQAHLDPSRAVL